MEFKRYSSDLIHQMTIIKWIIRCKNSNFKHNLFDTKQAGISGEWKVKRNHLKTRETENR